MAEDYSMFSDEELIQRLRDGEEPIMDYIIGKYKNLVRSKTKSLFILGADYDDLLQEGMIGLFKAIRDYDPGRDASFFTFAELCITRQAYTAVQSSSRKKHAFLNSYVSIYESGEKQENGDDMELLSSLVSPETRNPEELLIDKENVEQLEEAIDRELSDFEKQVLELHLTGMNYTEIAHVLGKTDKATDNALQRVKMKIKKVSDTLHKSGRKNQKGI